MDAGDQESNSTGYSQGTLAVAIIHRVHEALSRDRLSSHKRPGNCVAWHIARNRASRRSVWDLKATPEHPWCRVRIRDMVVDMGFRF